MVVAEDDMERHRDSSECPGTEGNHVDSLLLESEGAFPMLKTARWNIGAIAKRRNLRRPPSFHLRTNRSHQGSFRLALSKNCDQTYAAAP